MFRGYAEPRYLTTLTSGIDLFNRHLRITNLFDWRGGNTYYNQTERIRCTRPNCTGLFNPNASFAGPGDGRRGDLQSAQIARRLLPARRVREMARGDGYA